MPVPARPGAGAPFSEPPLPAEPPEPPRPPWPQPPSMPRLQRTEPVHIPTVVQPELTCPDPERHYACASLPSLDELRAKLIGLVQAPATKIAQLTTAPAAKLARVFAAYAEKDAA